MENKCCKKCYSTYTEHDYPTHTVYDACINQTCECHPSPKVLPKGVCSSCWGKGYYTQMHGVEGFEDFGGEGFIESPSVHKYPCSRCNGSGKETSHKEEIRYKENINCDNAIVEIESPKKEESMPFDKEWDLNNKGYPSPKVNGSYGCTIELDSPKVSKWEEDYEARFGKVALDITKSIISSTEKRVAKLCCKDCQNKIQSIYGKK